MKAVYEHLETGLRMVVDVEPQIVRGRNQDGGLFTMAGLVTLNTQAGQPCQMIEGSEFGSGEMPSTILVHTSVGPQRLNFVEGFPRI